MSVTYVNAYADNILRLLNTIIRVHIVINTFCQKVKVQILSEKQTGQTGADCFLRLANINNCE